jgi:MoaA/NifB/PqqE/SkfB family radical SAM enzyme
MADRVVVITGYTCNNFCRFCYVADKRFSLKDKTSEQIKRDLEIGREHGATYVDFIGGEATIRKDILELISYAEKLGFKKIKVTTNGRMFVYKDFAKKIVDNGLNGVIFSIHGHTAELHDFQTRSPGSFKEAVQGIKNLQKLGIYCETNTTISKLNYKFLPDMEKFFISLGVNNSEFVFCDPHGNACQDFEQIVPYYSEVQNYVHEALRIGIQNKVRYIMVNYIPFCFMQGFEKHIGEVFVTSNMVIEHRGVNFTDLDSKITRRKEARLKGPQCKKCKYYLVCEGIWKEYTIRRGFSELKPIPGEQIKDIKSLGVKIGKK